VLPGIKAGGVVMFSNARRDYDRSLGGRREAHLPAVVPRAGQALHARDLDVVDHIHERVHARFNEAQQSDQFVVRPDCVVLDAGEESDDALPARERVDERDPGGLRGGHKSAGDRIAEELGKAED
jgi:hypothetical protein